MKLEHSSMILICDGPHEPGYRPMTEFNAKTTEEITEMAGQSGWDWKGGHHLCPECLSMAEEQLPEVREAMEEGK